MKKKNKKKLAYGILMISTIILIFNNVGQLFTLVNIPFTQRIQMVVGICGMLISAVWYMYLAGAIK